ADGFVLVHAEDRTLCSVDGQVGTYLYPRSVGRTITMLPAGSRLTTTEMGNVSVILPPVFETPGPRYGSFLTCRLRVRVDDQWERGNGAAGEPSEKNSPRYRRGKARC